MDPKDGRCPGFYSSLYLPFERSIFYVNDPLLIDPDAWLLKFSVPEFSDASPEIIAARDRLITEMEDDNKLIEKYHLGLLSTANGHPRPREIMKLFKHPYMWYGHKRGIDGFNQFLWDKPTRAGCTLIGLITGRKMTNKGGADNQVPDYEIPLRSGLTPEEFLDLYAWELDREIVFLIWAQAGVARALDWRLKASETVFRLLYWAIGKTVMYLNAMRSQSISDKRASMQFAVPEKVISAIGTSGT